MSPTPTVLAALAASCRILANSNLADKKDVLEFHLRWVDLCRRDCAEELDDLAFRMAQFVVNHEPRLNGECAPFARSKVCNR
jgi:hypothetical protein